jgi:phosphatidylserine decarboxylase
MDAVVSGVRNMIGLCTSLLLAIWHREVGWPTIDRRTRQFKREQQPLLKKLKLLVLFNPITEWIDTTHVMRLWTHEKSLSAGISPFSVYNERSASLQNLTLSHIA